nr:axonemal p66.0 [Hymenolepis microstoma]
MPFKSLIESDADMLADRKAEYDQLKRALHLAQADREHYVVEMQSAMIKLKKSIELLEAEREELQNQIMAIDSKGNQTKDEKVKGDLVNMIENQEWLQEKIVKEKSKHEELNDKIRVLEKNLSALIRTIGSSHEAQSSLNTLLKKQAYLENQVILANKTYNEFLGKNLELRSDIDTLQMERDQFDSMYHKIVDALAKMKNEINKLTDLTTQAYYKREDAIQKIQALIERGNKEEKQHNTDMKELIRLIDHNRKLTDFIRAKIKERDEDPQLHAWRAKKAADAESRQKQTEETLEKYEHAFSKMLKLTQAPGSDRLMDSYIRNEDRNFSLFNYIIEIYEEVEQLQTKIDNLRKQIIENQAVVDKETDSINKELNFLRACNESIDENNIDIQGEFDKTQSFLQETAAMVGDLSERLHCDTSSIRQRLCAPEEVTFDTLLEYMALVEERVNNLLLIRQRIAKASADAPSSVKTVFMGGNLKPKSTAQALIVPPKMPEGFDAASEEGELKVPLSRENLHKLVVNQLRAKREESTKTARSD